MGNLKEELDRFNAINKYAEKLIIEQAPPLPPPAAAADPNAPPADPAAAGLPPEGTTTVPKTGDEESPEVTSDETSDDTTEEMDITDLVNMTKSIKKQLDNVQGQSQDTGMTQKMNDVFSKLGELENISSQMDQVLYKIDQLGSQIEQSAPKTPMEKLEMRSLDSYPFNKKPDEFFSEKLPEMKASGKNEYVLTKGDVENYGKNEIMKSFNPKAEENDYNF